MDYCGNDCLQTSQMAGCWKDANGVYTPVVLHYTYGNYVNAAGQPTVHLQQVIVTDAVGSPITIGSLDVVKPGECPSAAEVDHGPDPIPLCFESGGQTIPVMVAYSLVNGALVPSIFTLNGVAVAVDTGVLVNCPSGGREEPCHPCPPPRKLGLVNTWGV